MIFPARPNNGPEAQPCCPHGMQGHVKIAHYLWFGASRRRASMAFDCQAGARSLPGDIVIERENFRFYLPIGTSVLISVVLSLILWLLGR